jgi:hypothetical protein
MKVSRVPRFRFVLVVERGGCVRGSLAGRDVGEIGHGRKRFAQAGGVEACGNLAWGRRR